MVAGGGWQLAVDGSNPSPRTTRTNPNLRASEPPNPWAFHDSHPLSRFAIHVPFHAPFHVRIHLFSSSGRGLGESDRARFRAFPAAADGERFTARSHGRGIADDRARHRHRADGSRMKAQGERITADQLSIPIRSRDGRKSTGPFDHRLPDTSPRRCGTRNPGNLERHRPPVREAPTSTNDRSAGTETAREASSGI